MPVPFVVSASDNVDVTRVRFYRWILKMNNGLTSMKLQRPLRNHTQYRIAVRWVDSN